MEFLKVETKAQARAMLQQNGWLKKFIRENIYLEYIVDINKLKHKMNIPIEGDFITGTLEHLGMLRKVNALEEPTIGNSNESFQTLCNLFCKLKQNLRYQYEVLIPFILALHMKDCILFLKFISREIKIPTVFTEVM